jgi:cytochrome c553
MKPMLLTALLVASVGLVGNARAAGDAAAGHAKASTCAMCHGPDGAGTPGVPKLAGMDPAAFTQALHDYVSGKRVNAMMKVRASELSAADMTNLAAYYASIK